MEVLRHYVAYNYWANQIIIDFLHGINESDFSKDMKNSFSSIQATILHIFGAETLWLGRLQENHEAPFPIFETLPSKKETLDLWSSSGKAFADFITGCSDDFSGKMITYNRLGESYSSEAWWIVQHCMNHSTFHRGQIITMLRQLGYSGIPGTDFIVFYKYGKRFEADLEFEKSD